MAWLTREKAPLSKSNVRIDTPDGLWQRCDHCTEIVLRQELEANQMVCPKCNHHYYYPPHDRIRTLLDQESFVEHDAGLYSPDPLNFSDTKSYKDRIRAIHSKTGSLDAIVCGRGMLMSRPVHLGVFDFGFLGGSMGSVVGEKIARLFNRACDAREPAIVVSSSGGARMQEGILSLMQMAKTCAALGRMRSEGVPFISVLCNPTTGGVAASFATLGDVNIGEPGALIGFAGPRVIQQTIREKLPEGFQRSEYLLEHGMLDMIVHRDTMRQILGEILEILMARPGKQH